jgi:hypothetical protein
MVHSSDKILYSQRLRQGDHEFKASPSYMVSKMKELNHIKVSAQHRGRARGSKMKELNHIKVSAQHRGRARGTLGAPWREGLGFSQAAVTGKLNVLFHL